MGNETGPSYQPTGRHEGKEGETNIDQSSRRQERVKEKSEWGKYDRRKA